MAVVTVAALTPVLAGAETAVPAAPTCPASFQGMTPKEAADRYGLADLIRAGNRGQGVRIAQIQFQAGVDQAALDLYSECMGVPPVNLVTQNVGTTTDYGPTGESMSDAEMVAGLAPGIEGLYVFTSGETALNATTFDPMLLAALDPANTGGQLVDIISISYNSCEEDYGATDSTEAILGAAAAAGVWVLKGSGDSGSSGCAPHGNCSHPEKGEQAVGYPASSPFVISLGGVSLTEPDRPVTSPQVVWRDAGTCSGSGGGPSHEFDAPAWQAAVPGGLTDARRMVPDLSSLAGDPGYATYSPEPYVPPEPAVFSWRATLGDSLSGPVWAAALAIVRSELASRGVTIQGPLLPQLYAIANDVWDPATGSYGSVFTDVVPEQGHADNDVRGNGCCRTLVGFDMTNGLGTVDFGELTDALQLRDVVPAPMPPAVEPAFTG